MRIGGKLFTSACAVAVGIVGATPEGFAGVSAFLGDALDHRLTALGTKVCVFGSRLFGTMFETLCCEGFGKTSFGGKGR